MAKQIKTFGSLVAEEQIADPSFKAEWQRLAPARELATTLLRYRAEHRLNQRELAKKLGVSQPRVVKLESAEHNPEIDFVLDVALLVEGDLGDGGPSDSRAGPYEWACPWRSCRWRRNLPAVKITPRR